MGSVRRTLLAVAVATSAAAEARAQSCAVPNNTLTTDCGSSCATDAVCVLKNAACEVECLLDPTTPGYFTFLVPFDDSAGVPVPTLFKPNSELTAVGKLSFSAAVTNVVILGGSSVVKSTRGNVARVQFADGFLAGNAQLKMLTIENFDLAASIAALAGNLPPSLSGLWISNNLLTALPTELTKLQSLDSVYLSQNSIMSFTAYFPSLRELDLADNLLTEVPPVVAKTTKLTYLELSGNKIAEFKKEFAHESLTTLGLSRTNLSKFDVYLPNLTKLYLDGNSLTEIPPIVFSHTKLRELLLEDNESIKNVTLTNAQAKFLTALEDFTISKDAYTTDCVVAQQVTVKGFTVCITGGAVDLGGTVGTREPSASGSRGVDGGTSIGGTSASSSSSLPAVLGGVIGALALALVGGFVYCKKKRKGDGTRTINRFDANRTTKSNGVTSDLDAFNQGDAALWKDPDLLAVKVNANNIVDIQKIGHGTVYDVWLVQYRKSQRLASKRLNDVTCSHTQAFIEEIKLVAALSHPAIVQLIGAAWTKEADLQALFEFMDRGDLRTYLADDRSARAWSLLKAQIAVDVAEALVYVHSFNPPLVHRDLKSRNVLLNAAMQAKLTDFGVSRYESEQNTMTGGVGTARWLAPEVIAGSTDYGAPADIFSFGAVLSELDTHEIPYEHLRDEDGNKIADVAILQMVASGELRPSVSPSCPEEIAELAQLCLSVRPEDRPSAPEVAYALRSYKKRMIALSA